MALQPAGGFGVAASRWGDKQTAFRCDSLLGARIFLPLFYQHQTRLPPSFLDRGMPIFFFLFLCFCYLPTPAQQSDMDAL